MFDRLRRKASAQDLIGNKKKKKKMEQYVHRPQGRRLRLRILQTMKAEKIRVGASNAEINAALKDQMDTWDLSASAQYDYMKRI